MPSFAEYLVHRDAQDLGIAPLELGEVLLVRGHLDRSNGREGRRIEGQHHVLLSPIVAEADLLSRPLFPACSPVAISSNSGASSPTLERHTGLLVVPSMLSAARLRPPGYAPESRRARTGKKIRLSDYRGKKNVVLAFYPAAFTPV